jgi:hypothetical protein
MHANRLHQASDRDDHGDIMASVANVRLAKLRWSHRNVVSFYARQTRSGGGMVGMVGLFLSPPRDFALVLNF